VNRGKISYSYIVCQWISFVRLDLECLSLPVAFLFLCEEFVIVLLSFLFVHDTTSSPLWRDQSVFTQTRIFHLNMVPYFWLAEWLFFTRSWVWHSWWSETQSDSAKTSWGWRRRESNTAATWAVPWTEPPGLSLSWRTMSSSVRCGLTANLKGARVDLLLHLPRFRFGFKIISKESHAGVEIQIGVFIVFKQGSI
jgi:hypothetical protein